MPNLYFAKKKVKVGKGDYFLNCDGNKNTIMQLVGDYTEVEGSDLEFQNIENEMDWVFLDRMELETNLASGRWKIITTPKWKSRQNE
jgi:hypothetical protein